ncbi:MAG: Rieske 2Fe-2S domain-containing protein [Candidatus Methylomirabilis sp.]|nr:Rieske 2Fe-2S domain-containing protein [Deltaproteobacteria bacterium]
MSRFPFGIPNSWFHVGYSDELAKGQVKAIHFLGKEMVMFRGEDGKVGVLDAYCPHIGAHLGIGGKVVGNAVACPFHSWKFDCTGKCVDIPYTKKIPAKAVAGAYTVREHSGIIFIWHHAEGKAPDFDIPVIEQFGAEDWTRTYLKYVWKVRTQPQEIMENAIDWPHFHSVHGMAMPPDKQEKFEGKMFYWRIGTTKQIATMGGVTDNFLIQAQNWGLGFNFLTYDGMFSTVVTAGLTPIDEEYTLFQTGIIGKKDGRSEDETIALLKAYMDDQSNAITQDFEIWEHKAYRPTPALCDGDGPVARYRKWASQFYSQPAA